MLTIGDPAPDFTLTDQHGLAQRLSAFRGRPVVVYFYPKNDTPICTAEACAFRDAFESFAEQGVAVLGISSDSSRSHARFAGRHQLPFHLLADADGSVRRAWQVPRTLGLFPGRVTYVIDGEGVIRRIINASLQAERHVRESLVAIAALAPAASRGS